MQPFVKHFRSNAIAYVALFVALSGTAWAASKITTDDLAKNAVTSPKIAKGAVKGSDVAAGAIKPAKLATLPAAKVENVGGGSSFVALNDNQTKTMGWSVVDYDTAGFTDAFNGDNRKNLRAPYTGIYAVSAQVSWPNLVPASANGTRSLTIQGGADSVTQQLNASPNNSPTLSAAATFELQAGDDVFVRVVQNSGGSTPVRPDWFAVAYLGPGPAGAG